MSAPDDIHGPARLPRATLVNLASLALQIALDAPTTFSKFGSTTFIRRRLVRDIREELERAGVDWRGRQELVRAVRSAARSLHDAGSSWPPTGEPSSGGAP